MIVYLLLGLNKFCVGPVNINIEAQLLLGSKPTIKRPSFNGDGAKLTETVCMNDESVNVITKVPLNIK